MRADELAGQYRALVWLVPDQIHVLLSRQVNTYLCFQLKQLALRLRYKCVLMNSLDNIELESGLFLTKPMYSYHGR